MGIWIKLGSFIQRRRQFKTKCLLTWKQYVNNYEEHGGEPTHPKPIFYSCIIKPLFYFTFNVWRI